MGRLQIDCTPAGLGFEFHIELYNVFDDMTEEHSVCCEDYTALMLLQCRHPLAASILSAEYAHNTLDGTPAHRKRFKQKRH